MDISGFVADHVCMSSYPASVGNPVRSWVAWSVCGLDLVLLAAVLVLGLVTFFVTPFVGTPLSAAIAAPIGAMVVSRRSGSRSGWLLLMFATAVALAVAFLQTALYAAERGIGELATVQALIAAGEVCFLLILLALPLLLLTFPDGRLLSPRWRPVVGLLVALVVYGAVASVVFAGNVTDPAAYIASLEFGGGEGAVVSEFVESLDVVAGVLFSVVFVASAGSLLVRLRGAVGEERQQLKWVVYTGILALVLFPMDLVRSSSTVVWTVQQVLAAAGAWLLPVGFGLALFKYRLWDIDVVIRRSVVYGVLWLGIAGAYVGVAAGLGLVAGPVEVAIGLTVLATLVFQPAWPGLGRSRSRPVSSSSHRHAEQRGPHGHPHRPWGRTLRGDDLLPLPGSEAVRARRRLAGCPGGTGRARRLPRPVGVQDRPSSGGRASQDRAEHPRWRPTGAGNTGWPARTGPRSSQRRRFHRADPRRSPA